MTSPTPGLPPDDTDHIPTDTQGATSSAKTPAAPCYPATCNEHEVHTS